MIALHRWSCQATGPVSAVLYCSVINLHEWGSVQFSEPIDVCLLGGTSGSHILASGQVLSSIDRRGRVELRSGCFSWILGQAGSLSQVSDALAQAYSNGQTCIPSLSYPYSISKLIKPDFLSLLLGPLLPSYGEGLAGLRWLGVVNLMYFAQTVLQQCHPDHVFRVRNEGALQARRAGSDFG